MIDAPPASNFQKEVKQRTKVSFMEPFLPKEMTPDLAEIYGIHAGDGYLQLRDRNRFVLELDCDVDEKAYYDEHVVPLFEKTFKINITPRFFPHRHTYGFFIYNKKICEFIHSLGFPYGEKTYSVKVPKPILQSNNIEVARRFVKGVFDTDGTVSFRRRIRLRGKSENSKRHTYPRLLLDVCSPDLCFGVGQLLERMEEFRFSISYQRASGNHKKKYKLCLAGDRNLLFWTQDIGFKNNVKNNRVLIWERFGFNPPKLKLSDQIDILSGGKDPNTFYTDGELYYERKDSAIARNKQLLKESIKLGNT